jgi:hypothetical protein
MNRILFNAAKVKKSKQKHNKTKKDLTGTDMKIFNKKQSVHLPLKSTLNHLKRG